MKFCFGDIVVIEKDLIGVIVKSFENFKDMTYNYDVYVRSYNLIKNYNEDKIERYMVRHKELNEEELKFQEEATFNKKDKALTDKLDSKIIAIHEQSKTISQRYSEIQKFKEDFKNITGEDFDIVKNEVLIRPALDKIKKENIELKQIKNKTDELKKLQELNKNLDYESKLYDIRKSKLTKQMISYEEQILQEAELKKELDYQIQSARNKEVILNKIKTKLDTELDSKYDSLLNLDIQEVIQENGCFYVRIYNCLYRGGIRTLADWLSKSPNELSRIRNLGKKSYYTMFKIFSSFCEKYSIKLIYSEKEYEKYF